MMTKNITDVTATIVEALMPLQSEERQRVVQAALTLLGETPLKAGNSRVTDLPDSENEDLPPRARTWMKQNALSKDQLLQVFQIDAEGVDVIAEIPGKINREKVRNAYVLLGVARLLSTGEPKFDDKAARSLCENSGFFDGTNHMKFMKGGN